MGAANKVSGNKITGIKVLKKILPKKNKQEKSPQSLENEFKSFIGFHKKGIFFYASTYWQLPYRDAFNLKNLI